MRRPIRIKKAGGISKKMVNIVLTAHLHQKLGATTVSFPLRNSHDGVVERLSKQFGIETTSL